MQVESNFVKTYLAMGYQRVQANQLTMESIIKARSSENGEWISASKTPRPCDHRRPKECEPSSTEPNASDDNYKSWVVSVIYTFLLLLLFV